MDKEGRVSLWIGTFDSFLELDNYIKVSYNEGFIDSQFEKDFHIDYYDDELKEADCIETQTNDVSTLIEGFSHDEVLIPKIKKLCGDKFNEMVNAIILLYNFNYNKPISEVNVGENKLKFIGSFNYL
ncbi:immunity 22 family protein [Clostridium sp. 'deep sea']|uniref:immunity 22 family protein n=1 Tax=Clostridium sp. 'deep sea' TaxID=2779445 RepID=UPI0018966106|nr:immunity 22 family protein [Clostridium sp. 'deep sea']QOR35260.1 immunity 22 family protein [Clostridium sp. 'deep sea']